MCFLSKIRSNVGQKKLDEATAFNKSLFALPNQGSSETNNFIKYIRKIRLEEYNYPPKQSVVQQKMDDFKKGVSHMSNFDRLIKALQVAEYEQRPKKQSLQKCIASLENDLSKSIKTNKKLLKSLPNPQPSPIQKREIIRKSLSSFRQKIGQELMQKSITPHECRRLEYQLNQISNHYGVFT